VFRSAVATLGDDFIRPIKAAWRDVVIPGEVELLRNYSYSPMYAWMYSYEKRLKKRLHTEAGRLPIAIERSLFGADGGFSEGLSNAFLHGHGRDPRLPIAIDVKAGSRGLLLAISDQGSGFDFETSILRAERGAHTFRIAGNGLRGLVANPDVYAWYADAGRTLLLLAPTVRRELVPRELRDRE